MTITKFTLRVFILALLMSFIFGCGGGGGDDDNGNNTNNGDTDNVDNTDDADNTDNPDVAANNFAGTWLITKEDSVSFWIFNEDGTFIKKRSGEPVNGQNHFVGTYSVTDGFITGEFTNPGVGNGEIEGFINAEDTFLMDFIEYWHNPRKVVPCVGVRQ